MAGRHRAPGPRIAVNAARIAVGGLVLAEITGGLPAIPAYASTPEVTSMPVVLAASHHGTDKHHSKKHHHSKKTHHVAAKRPVHVAVVQAAVVVPAAQSEPAAAPESQLDSAMAQQQLFDHYIVQPGDTLTHIAAAYGIPWESMWAFNTDQLPHPDAVFPGQRLRLPA